MKLLLFSRANWKRVCTSWTVMAVGRLHSTCLQVSLLSDVREEVGGLAYCQPTAYCQRTCLP